jgi:hypothetical protein
MMTKRPPGSFGRALAAAEGHWTEEPDGFQLRVWDAPLKATPDRIEVALPRDATRKFRPRADERLVARIAGNRLVVEREKGSRPPRSSER